MASLIKHCAILIFACSFLLVNAASVALCQKSPIGENLHNNYWPQDAQITSNEKIQSRLRITWGGSVAKRWQGSIRFDGALIENPAVVGFGLNSSSSIHVANQKITIRQRSESTFEGLDIDVIGSPNSKMIVEFGEPNGQPLSFEILLSQVMSRDQVVGLDQHNNRFSISRAPGDSIQFKTNHRSLVFEPKEPIKFSIRANHVPPNVASGSCRIEIAHARQNESVLHSWDATLNLNDQRSSSFLEQIIEAPQEEGIYNIRLTLGPRIGHRTNSFMRLNKPQTNISREIQIVVIDPRRTPKTASQFDAVVASVDPTTLKSSVPQLDQFSRLVGFRKTAQSMGKFTISSDGLSVELGAGGWQAIPLSINQPGKQHVIEIDYPDGQPMSLGMSVLQTDESGQIPQFGFDSGFRTPYSIVAQRQSDQGRTLVHRFTCWPNQRDFVLLVANRSQSHKAYFSNIRVRESSNSSRVEGTVSKTTITEMPNRKFMVFYEQPLFAENFGANKQPDSGLGQSISDWVTFYEGATRLVQYLKDAGADGAFVNVFGEGSSLMPLQTTFTTPRYDSGVFSTVGHDPVRKDVVEMLFRIFEREKLWLVPVLSFDQRCSQIEFSNDPDVFANSSLVDYRQRTNDPEQFETLPVYNPLSQAVQQHISNIVREISDRYRNQRSYGGLALTCRPDTLTMLPGSRSCGYDTETLQKFASQLPVATSVSSSDDTSRLVDDNYDVWLQWRSSTMTNWYQNLAKLVSGQNEQAKLFLPLVDIFRSEEAAGILSPSLYRTADIDEVMLRLGFDKRLNDSDNLAVMHPVRLAPIHPLSSMKSECLVEESGKLEEWFANSKFSASLFTHRSSWARFENLEGSQLFPQQTDPILRLQQLQPGGPWNRQRFAKSLLNSDTRLLVDGGLLLSTELDSELRDFLKIFSDLPDVPFSSLQHQDNVDEIHPIAVRFVKHNESSYMYCVNGSPWELTATILCNKPANMPWQPLGGLQNVPLDAGSNGRLQLRMAPFDLVGIKVDSNQVQFHEFSYSLPPEAQRDLSTSFYKLRSRLVAAGNASSINLLLDPGFENEDLNRGWSIGDQQQESFSIEQQDVFHGQSSLQIDNRNNSNVWIRSNEFPPPVTGRLSASVWLKVEDESQQPPLRISIESTDPNSNYYRFAEVGSLVVDCQQNQLENQWKRFAVHFDDLPQERLSGLRFGFDMMGPGTVHVDKLELFDRWMDENDQKTMTQMFATVGPLLQQPDKLERCRQMLSGYWPSFLREYFDDEAGSPPVRSAMFNEPPPAARSSMRKRFRRFVSPKIFQFR